MIFIALGGNLSGPDGQSPKATLARALLALEQRGIAVRRRSRWYRSAPVPCSDQDWFVNAVAEVATALEPSALLAAMHAVEAELGRVRETRNGPRTCDLDLLDYDGRVVAGDAPSALCLPHPRLHERLFVLLPLAELSPGWRHPVSGMTVGALIAAAPSGQVCEPDPACDASS